MKSRHLKCRANRGRLRRHRTEQPWHRASMIVRTSVVRWIAPVVLHRQGRADTLAAEVHRAVRVLQALVSGSVPREHRVLILAFAVDPARRVHHGRQCEVRAHPWVRRCHLLLRAVAVPMIAAIVARRGRVAEQVRIPGTVLRKVSCTCPTPVWRDGVPVASLASALPRRHAQVLRRTAFRVQQRP